MLEVRSHYRKEHHNKSVNSIDVCMHYCKVFATSRFYCLQNATTEGQTLRDLVMCITLSRQRVDTHMVMPDGNKYSFCMMLSSVS